MEDVVIIIASERANERAQLRAFGFFDDEPKRMRKERAKMCTLRVSARACVRSYMEDRNARDKNLCIGLLNKGTESCYCYCCAAAAAYFYPSTSIWWLWWEFACIACVDFLDFMAYSCYILHTQLNERKRKTEHAKARARADPCSCRNERKPPNDYTTMWVCVRVHEHSCSGEREREWNFSLYAYEYTEKESESEWERYSIVDFFATRAALWHLLSCCEAG